MVNADKGDDMLKDALDHAWDWFSLHATQRLQAVNFYLVATAFLSAAFVTAVKESMYVLAGGISILAACISYMFYRMERRIQSLIKAAERAIRPLEATLAAALDNDALRIVDHVEEGQVGEWKYSKVFRYLYFVTGSAFGLGFIYACWTAQVSATGTTAFGIAVQATLGIFFVACGYEMLFGTPRGTSSASAEIARLWSLVLLGWACILFGMGIVGHLIVCRL